MIRTLEIKYSAASSAPVNSYMLHVTNAAFFTYRYKRNTTLMAPPCALTGVSATCVQSARLGSVQRAPANTPPS